MLTSTIRKVQNTKGTETKILNGDKLCKNWFAKKHLFVSLPLLPPFRGKEQHVKLC